jgi:hypothetical protein
MYFNIKFVHVIKSLNFQIHAMFDVICAYENVTGNPQAMLMLVSLAVTESFSSAVTDCHAWSFPIQNYF